MLGVFAVLSFSRQKPLFCFKGLVLSQYIAQLLLFLRSQNRVDYNTVLLLGLAHRPLVV